MGDYLVHYLNKSSKKLIFQELHKISLPKLIKKIEIYFKGIISGENLDSLMPDKRCNLCIIYSPSYNTKVAKVELRGKKIYVEFIPSEDYYFESKNSIRTSSWKK